MSRFNQHPIIRQIPFRLRGGDQDKFNELIESHIRQQFSEANTDLPGQDFYERIIQEVERPLIKFALEQCRGNQIKAARMLGINRNTLHKKIKMLNIPVVRKSNGHF